MVTIDAQLELPLRYFQGLSDGTYERVGGIVRETQSKHVVAWLRDSVDTHSKSSLPTGLASLSMASRAAHVIPIVNMALTSATLLILTKGLLEVSKSIKDMESALKAEFQLDRVSHLTAALKLAKIVEEASSSQIRQQNAVKATFELNKAISTLGQEFQSALANRSLQLAAMYYVSYGQALIAVVRCYLEIDEYDLAKQNLLSELTVFRSMADGLVSSALGEHPALMLHRDFSDADVERFINVFEWLRGEPFRELLVKELRRDFWEVGLTQLDVGRVLKRQSQSPLHERRELAAQSLALAEDVIENYNRLEGFAIELRSMRLLNKTFREWQHLQTDSARDVVLLPDQPLDVSAA